MDTFAELITVFCVKVFMNALYALLGGFGLTVAVALVHYHWIPQVPLIGYWIAVLIVFFISLVFFRLPQED